MLSGPQQGLSSRSGEALAGSFGARLVLGDKIGPVFEKLTDALVSFPLTARFLGESV